MDEPNTTFNKSYTGLRPELLALVPQSAKSVLDIGCGTGALSETIKRRQSAQVVGIELSSEMAKEAESKLDKVIVGNLDEIDLATAIEGYRFDCIICGDVIEHIKDPWTTLQILADHLSEGGVIVASIPNIRHISTLINLLFLDKWPYRERGIHDRTHLRFFTWKSIQKLFTGAGLSIVSQQRKYRIIERPNPLNRISPIFAVPGLRSFLTFQYLLVARK